METLCFLMVSTHYPPYYMGGDANFVRYLAEELFRRGHEVAVIYNPSVYGFLRRTAALDLSEVAGEGPIRVEYVPRHGFLSLLGSLSLGCWKNALKLLRDNVRIYRPDVVHWHNTKGFIGKPVAMPGVVNLCTAHDFYLVCPRSNLLKPGGIICENPRFCQLCLIQWKKPLQLWRIAGRRIIRPPAEMKVISPSKFMSARLAQDGIRVHHVIRNFVPDKAHLIRERSKPDTLLYLGVLELLKGPHLLLEAFAKTIHEQGFQLRMFGEGMLKRKLSEKVISAGLRDRVSIHGFTPLEKLGPVLSRTAAIIIPSLSHENAPLVALEAFSMGIPVIGSNYGGLPEMLTPESGSMLFKGSDVSSLGDALCFLWNSRDSISYLSARARKTYEKTYSPDAHLREYLRIIRKSTPA